MLKLYRRLTPWLLCAGLTLLMGCVSPNAQQTRFYRLSPESGSASSTNQTGEMSALQPKVGLGPVNLSGYLDRPQLISRIGPYQLILNDFEHWAGTLQDNIKAGLVDALQARLGGDAVIAYPWHGAVRPSYELILDFSRFDAEAGQLVLKVRWILLTERGDKLLAVRQVAIQEPMGGAAPEALVAAASRALDRLAEQLAAVIGSYP
ncbi:MAG: PqiC family protein [Pseudomonadota bacterium]